MNLGSRAARDGRTVLAVGDLLINPVGGVTGFLLALRALPRRQRLLGLSRLRNIWSSRNAAISVIILVNIAQTTTTNLFFLAGILCFETHGAVLIRIRLPSRLLLLPIDGQLLVGNVGVCWMAKLTEVVNLRVLLLSYFVLGVGHFLERQIEHELDYGESAYTGNSILCVCSDWGLRLLRQEQSADLAVADLDAIYFLVKVGQLLIFLEWWRHASKW